ncbi:MAG TPA: ATP-dependent zinc metalloprotease FtsH [Actinomycetota bacterium]|nr:ATP-dependent zinc metalloprotease FtsH [Actinomycetota bacterium]
MVDRFRNRETQPPKGEPAGPSGPSTDPNRQRWTIVGWVVASFALFYLLQGGFQQGPEEISLSRLMRLAEDVRIEEATVSETSVEGRYLPAEGEEAESFVTTLPPNYDTSKLVRQLDSKNVEVSGAQPSALSSLFISLLPFLLIGLLYYFFIVRRLRNLGGGAGGPLSLGKNKAKLYDRTDLKTTFADVAGVDEVEAELVELVDYLKNSDKYKKVGARIPKGVLLVGPPGTGKTLLARAVAGEAQVPFFYISASEFIELFVGLGAARVRDLFQQARERAPAIVFIDEIDAIGQSRSGAAGYQMGSNQEQEQTLQQLLTEMDGFEANTGVIIVAASNRPEVLDQALLRPGRFDRQIQVNLPEVKGREQILAIHARDVELEPDADLKVLARRTPGFSGAQLANVINEGALLAARKGKSSVGMPELEEAVDRVVAGLERRSQVLTEDERRLVAYHELGHALVAHFVEHSDPVHRVSIIPRGIGALGYTQQLPDEERYLMSEPELHDRIAVLLGGRAAEETVFGFATTGAQDDLRKATEIARRMVMEFGMSPRVGPINIADNGPRFLSPAFRRSEDVSDETEVAIDREVKSILMQGQERARGILKDRRGDLDELAVLLLERENLSGRDLEDHFAAGATSELSGAPAPSAAVESAGSSERLGYEGL